MLFHWLGKSAPVTLCIIVLHCWKQLGSLNTCVPSISEKATTNQQPHPQCSYWKVILWFKREVIDCTARKESPWHDCEPHKIVCKMLCTQFAPYNYVGSSCFFTGILGFFLSILKMDMPWDWGTDLSSSLLYPLVQISVWYRMSFL